MNAKRERFVEAFVGEARRNATKAAILAGYSEKSATKIASELLTFPDVQAAVAAREQALIAKSSLSSARIIEELSKVAEADVKVSSADKMKALELLGKHRKLWQDKAPTDARITVTIGYLHTTQHPVTIDATPVDAVTHFVTHAPDSRPVKIDSPSALPPISVDNAPDNLG